MEIGVGDNSKVHVLKFHQEEKPTSDSETSDEGEARSSEDEPGEL